jgi:L,D-transpeptidase catalytic domain
MDGRKQRTACLRFSSPRHRDETIPYLTKSFCAFDANFLKPLSDTDAANKALKSAPRRSNRTYHAQSRSIEAELALCRSRLRRASDRHHRIFRLRRGYAAAAVSLHHDAAGPMGAAAGAIGTLRRRRHRHHAGATVVSYATREAPGTIIIDTPNTYLYYVLGGGRAIRYGIGVGRDGFTWSGVQSVTKKAEWPDWTPPPEMIARQPYLPRHMAGGPGNPLGARAMYLGGTIYRIHGTNAPETIGTRVSSGCIRLTNEDVADLYSRVNVGTKVIVLPMDRRADNATGKRG